ncbi:MAG: RNA methyltransferase, partial [Shinella sp.]
MAAAPIRIDDPGDPRIAGFVSIRERDLTGRDGLFIAEGTVVLRMLGQGAARGNGFAAEAILLLENRLAGLGEVLDAFPESVPVYVAAQPVFDAIAGFNMHRGVLALGRKPAADIGAALLGRLPA